LWLSYKYLVTGGTFASCYTYKCLLDLNSILPIRFHLAPPPGTKLPWYRWWCLISAHFQKWRKTKQTKHCIDLNLIEISCCFEQCLVPVFVYSPFVVVQWRVLICPMTLHPARAWGLNGGPTIAYYHLAAICNFKFRVHGQESRMFRSHSPVQPLPERPPLFCPAPCFTAPIPSLMTRRVRVSCIMSRPSLYRIIVGTQFCIYVALRD